LLSRLFWQLALIALQHLQLKYPCDAIKELLVAIDTVFAFAHNFGS
jgi:hypothetical protein